MVKKAYKHESIVLMAAKMTAPRTRRRLNGCTVQRRLLAGRAWGIEIPETDRKLRTRYTVAKKVSDAAFLLVQSYSTSTLIIEHAGERDLWQCRDMSFLGRDLCNVSRRSFIQFDDTALYSILFVGDSLDRVIPYI